jgi:hypothetical protein
MGKLYRAIGCGGVFGSSVASLFRAADASETAAGRPYVMFTSGQRFSATITFSLLYKPDTAFCYLVKE